jgi:hypothetical protein
MSSFASTAVSILAKHPGWRLQMSCGIQAVHLMFRCTIGDRELAHERHISHSLLANYSESLSVELERMERTLMYAIDEAREEENILETRARLDPDAPDVVAMAKRDGLI